jgi:predicted metal-dependent hydrolase
MTAIDEGISLFNAHAFWHAHEAWERDWLAATDPHKQFLQGLIQLAAAYHHVQRGTYRGGVRLFDAALRRLAPFPADYAGVNRADAVRVAAEHRERIARGEKIDAREFPKLYN